MKINLTPLTIINEYIQECGLLLWVEDFLRIWEFKKSLELPILNRALVVQVSMNQLSKKLSHQFLNDSILMNNVDSKLTVFAT